MKLLYFIVGFLGVFTISTTGVLFPIEPRHPLAGKIWPPGSPWPLPKNWRESTSLVTVDAFLFHFVVQVANNTGPCEPLTYALEKYDNAFLFPTPLTVTDPNYPILAQARVVITGNAETNECANYPRLSEDSNYEHYELVVSGGSSASVTITAETVWGAIRGIETLSQLFWANGRADGRQVIT